MALPRRRLGRSGLEVSRFGLGCMGFGPRERWFGGADAKEAERIVGRALEAGINFFDTADIYNDGVSEELLGRALGRRRAEAVIATKVRFPMRTGPQDEGLSRRNILRACDASLKRLGVETIDLYQVHAWDPGVPIEETMLALDELVRSGKVRFLGCSNFSGAQLGASLLAADGARFESDQVPYSLLYRFIEDDLRGVCAEQEVGVIVYGPLAGGFLTGKSNPRTGHPPLDRHRAQPMARVLGAAAKASGSTPAQLALAWVASRPWVDVTLLGATSVAQLEENLAAADLAPAPGLLSILDRASDVVTA